MASVEAPWANQQLKNMVTWLARRFCNGVTEGAAAWRGAVEGAAAWHGAMEGVTWRGVAEGVAAQMPDFPC